MFPLDTICAMATPSGKGALGVIRISGTEAISILKNIFFPSKRFQDTAYKPYQVSYGKIIYQNELIDEVLVSVFLNPNSFTGEDVVEISCHGSKYILNRLMEILLECGCRLAQAGEFSQRAFLNRKMDLSQTEAIADIIASDSALSHKVAMKQLRGGYSDKMKLLREELIRFTSLIELELDFSEEDVEFVNRKQLIDLLSAIKKEVHILIESFKIGNIIKEGINAVIIGKPNAGKSTLLNQLLQEEKALVSDIAGTTRDVIEDVLSVNGIKIRFIDTAGLRATQDILEGMGIERTKQKIEQADIILLVFDINQTDRVALQAQISELPKHIPLILIANKIDAFTAPIPNNYLPISAKDGVGIEALKEAIMQSLQLNNLLDKQEAIIVTNIRHIEALKIADSSISRIEQALMDNLSGDLMVVDIRIALNALGSITSEISSDEILGAIFSKFCIGK